MIKRRLLRFILCFIFLLTPVSAWADCHMYFSQQSHGDHIDCCGTMVCYYIGYEEWYDLGCGPWQYT